MLRKQKTGKTVWITRTAILLALALVFQMGGFPQPVTGPVVNLVLFLAVLTVGISSSIVIGILTPVTAYVAGVLPPLLSPMIPFIAIGNALLGIIFGLLLKKNFFLGVVVAALGKFILLATAVRFLVDVEEEIAYMMSFPQFLTALGGGLLAFLIYRVLKASEAIEL